MRGGHREARLRGADLTVVHVSPTYLPVALLGPMVPMMGSVPPLLEETSREFEGREDKSGSSSSVRARCVDGVPVFQSEIETDD